MMRSLAIISHTKHFCRANGEVVGWEPTLREINHLINIFDIIYHIAPLYKGMPHKANISYASKKIIFIPIIPTGGKRMINKLGILFFMPFNLYRIIQTIRKVEWIHFRAPTNLGVFVLPLMSLYSKKNKWVKYAGNWQQKSIPISYRFQRWWLNRNIQNSLVTINSKRIDQKSHLLSFENPCLTAKEISINKKSGLKKKFIGKLTFCFVGMLEDSKGLPALLDTIDIFNETDWIDKLHCVGEESDRKKIVQANSTDNIPIIFHGILGRQEINQIYEDSHFIILPSQSEGFPKVLAEASSFGCIPIVPPIPSIIFYINEKKRNGIILDDITPQGIKKTIKNLQQIRSELSIFSANAMENTRQFSYEYYNHRIENDILSG